METLLDKKKLRMVAGCCCIPKDNPEKPLGEDSHFFSEEAQAIGVADGVGAWAKKGVDSGIYARNLMTNAEDALFDDSGRPYSSVDPKKVLELAYFATEAEGSSTACIITLAGDVLRAANLGDSGFAVIRDGKAVYKSPVQQHRFNRPYQLGRRRRSDRPDKAEEIEVKVAAGDVVVAGTDGLFDNVFMEDIETVVREWLSGEKSLPPDLMACALAWAALERSTAEDVVSPFALAAYEAGVPHFGGKYDDITVVAAYIF